MNVAGVVPLLASLTDGLFTARASGSWSSIVSRAEASPSVACDVHDALDVARSERQPTAAGTRTRKSIL